MDPKQEAISDKVDAKRGSVLLVDDDVAVLRVVALTLTKSGYAVDTASDGLVATSKLEGRSYDVVVSDISMPGMNGLDLLRAIRAHDLDVPVLLMTGAPDLASAIRAVEYGALRYLIKPVAPSVLLPAVEYAVRMSKMARIKREALLIIGDADKFVGDRVGLEACFSRALSGLWMAYQPIVVWSEKRIYAYEALVRSTEPTLAYPGALLSAAERLGRLQELGRAIRDAVTKDAAQAPPCQLFVNLHPFDLNDDELFSSQAPLSRLAKNVVLEITERVSLDGIRDVQARVKTLRAMGYRIALDDLGAGYAGLSSFAQLQPEVVKFDMSLVREVDKDPTRQKVIGTMSTLSKELGMMVVVEGVETRGELDALLKLGCDVFQGHLFAKPGRPFPQLNQTLLRST